MTKKELTECMSELSDMIIEFKKEDIYIQAQLRGYENSPLSISAYIQDELRKEYKSIYDYEYKTLRDFIDAIYNKKNEMLKSRVKSKEERIKDLEKELEELKNENN